MPRNKNLKVSEIAHEMRDASEIFISKRFQTTSAFFITEEFGWQPSYGRGLHPTVNPKGIYIYICIFVVAHCSKRGNSPSGSIWIHLVVFMLVPLYGGMPRPVVPNHICHVPLQGEICLGSTWGDDSGLVRGIPPIWSSLKLLQWL